MKMIVSLVAALTVGAAAAMAQAPSVDKEIAERIAPVDKTCMQGDKCAAAVAAAPAASGGAPRSGEAIFKAHCTTCHTPGAAGAPKFGNAADWAPRIAKGMDTLYTHAINGFNAMPPRGLCTDCSDDEVKGAVDYMTSHSK
ncbi:cytochrome c5 family protein [Microbulbifer sp. SAOS-129_SWC]|uniref:c-type cytochrome n=1 Tax=Microbulbifer sp. SAOS-129_SWC TaxID=3145235 RepID=UPI003217BA8A